MAASKHGGCCSGGEEDDASVTYISAVSQIRGQKNAIRSATHSFTAVTLTSISRLYQGGEIDRKK